MAMGKDMKQLRGKALLHQHAGLFGGSKKSCKRQWLLQQDDRTSKSTRSRSVKTHYFEIPPEGKMRD